MSLRRQFGPPMTEPSPKGGPTSSATSNLKFVKCAFSNSASSSQFDRRGLPSTGCRDYS
jgi:hypothetical protein